MNKLTIIPIIAILVLVLTVSFASAVPVAPDNADVIAYWSLDGTSGTVANDSAGSNNGSIVGSAWVTGVLNNGLEASGTDDADPQYFYMASSDKLNVNATSFWFEPSSLGINQPLFYAGTYAGTDHKTQITLSSTNKLNYNYRIGNSLGANYYNLVSNDSAVLDWNHIVIQKNDGVMQYYLNGVQQTMTLSYGSNTNKWFMDLGSTIDRFHFGKFDRGYSSGILYSDGVFDEISFFDVALTSDEITFLYNEGTPTSDQQYPFTTPENFTASARNEWSDAIINNFTINISSVGLNQDWRNTTLSVSGGKVINIFFNQYNLTYNGTTIVVGNDCIIYEGDIITFAAVGGRLFCDSSPGISRILLNPYISGENFTLTGIGDYTASTTTGEILTSIISEELANITFFSDNYFDRTYSDWNLSDNLEANLHQSEISFLTKELITNDTLTGVTYVIDGTTDTTFNLSIGEHTVTASKSGYYDLNYTFSVTALQNETLNITGMFDSILNITLSKYPSAATINNFTITTSHQTTSTTTGFVELHTLQGYLNVINITSSGYASRFNQEFTTTALLNSTDYTMYLFNSIRILIYNETSDDLIDFQNVTINTISTLTTFENTSTTGNITLGFLNPTTYELRFSSANYTTRSYFLTVNNDTTQEIKVYLMLNTSNVDLQRVKVIDGGNNAIGGSTIWLQKEDVGTFTTVNQRISGSDGLATFYVKKDIDQYYRFIVIQDGTVVLTTEKTVFVPGIDDIIELVITAADITDDTALVDFWSINTTVWITGDNEEIINYQFIDGQDTINGGRLLITMEDLLTGEIITKYNITKTGNNGLYTVALDELNDSIYNIKAYITYSDGTELVVWEGTKTFTITVIVKRNTGLLYAILILLFAAFLTSKDFNPLFSLIISFGILIPLTYLKIISVPIGVITGFITLAIIVFIKIRGGGNQ